MTLDEVRKAGRFAWHRQWQVWTPVRGVVQLLGDETVDDGFGGMSVAVEGNPDCEWVAAFGWHHLPACDCEYCRVDNGTDPAPATEPKEVL